MYIHLNQTDTKFVKFSSILIYQRSTNSKELTIYEPQHEISNNVVCATSKVQDQPAHTRSLIRSFASHLNTL